MTEIRNYIRSRFVDDWHTFVDPSVEEITRVIKEGASHYGDLTAGRTIKDGEEITKVTHLEIVRADLENLDIPGSNVDEHECCIIYRQTYSEKNPGEFTLLVWSPEISVNEKIEITEHEGGEFPAWDCNIVPISFTIDFVRRLLEEGYEGEDLLWATEEECETLNFKDRKK